MKKFISITLTIILFILYIILFFDISFNRFLKKDNVIKVINNIEVEKLSLLQEEKDFLEYKDAIKDVVTNSLLSVFEIEKKYTQKDVLDMIDTELDKKSIVGEERENTRNRLYDLCDKLMNRIPSSENLDQEEKNIINSFKNFISNQKLVIMLIVIVTLLLVPINFFTLEWLKYSGAALVSSSIIYILLLYGIQYFVTGISTRYLYEFLYLVFKNMYNSFLNTGIIFAVIGMIQIVICFIINSFKTQTNINEEQ